MDPVGDRLPRPSAFDKMEGLVREMQDPEAGVPVRSQKLFLTSIPYAFMGYDLIEWLMERLAIEESEALNIANQLCQFGYIFPVNDSKNLTVKDDSSLYRFQSSYYWPYQNRPPDQVEYAIYLAKRTLRNKQRHGLEDYEIEALGNLRKNLANKWEFITIQAEELAKICKELKKGDKVVSDSQERAYWRIHRPPPGLVSTLEQCPVPVKNRNGPRLRTKALEDLQREVDMLKNNLTRSRVKMSQALENIILFAEQLAEFDPMITACQPSNPWVTEDMTYWQVNAPIVDYASEKRLRRWALDIREVWRDPTGVREFAAFLKTEFSQENIRFYMAVRSLRRCSVSLIPQKINQIFNEYFTEDAPLELNIDMQTKDRVRAAVMSNPNKYSFEPAADHIYNQLIKKDCYPRFIRSDYYKNLVALAVPPSQKKRFFGFGQTKKKISTTVAPNTSSLLQHQGPSCSSAAGALSKRRGSDRSLSGSAHELAVSGVKDTRVPHSHSQSNLSDIPYRGELPYQAKHPVTILQSPVKKPNIALVAGASTSEDVCPWDVGVVEPRSRKNSIQLDSGSSSSDISVAVADVSDRLRRQCGLTQQFTVDGDRRAQTGRKLSTATCGDTVRRASISAPIPPSETTTLPKRAASSSEECQPSPEPETDNNKGSDESSIAQQKTFKKSHSLVKTCSVTGANAPIISVSSVADDSIEEPQQETEEPIQAEAEAEADEAKAGPSHQQLAPLAEPDCESPISDIGPEPPGAEGDAKNTDVCPWEDEETCKVDTPFVKTYATLGYL